MHLNMRTIPIGAAGWTADLYTSGKNRALLKTVQGTVEPGEMKKGVCLDLLVESIWRQTKHVGDLNITLSQSSTDAIDIEATGDTEGIEVHSITPGGSHTPSFVSGRFSAMVL